MTKTEIEESVTVLQKVAELEIGPDLLLGAAVGRLMAQGCTLDEISTKVAATYVRIGDEVQSALEDVIHGE